MSTVTIDPSTGAAVAAGPARFPGLTGCAVGTRPPWPPLPPLPHSPADPPLPPFWPVPPDPPLPPLPYSHPPSPPFCPVPATPLAPLPISGRPVSVCTGELMASRAVWPTICNGDELAASALAY